MSDSLKKQIDGDHYKNMGIQPWEIIEKNGLDYFEGAALKYLLRWRKKDGIIDLDKVIHYVERIKELAQTGHYKIEQTIKPGYVAKCECEKVWHGGVWCIQDPGNKDRLFSFHFPPDNPACTYCPFCGFKVDIKYLTIHNR